MTATCPKCQQKIAVPERPESSTDNSGSSPKEQAVESRENGKNENDRATEMDPLAEFAVYDVETEWVVEETDDNDAQQRPAPAGLVDQEKVAVPRRLLYAQGILLGVVAIVCFLIGLLMGNLTATLTTVNAEPQPCLLRGQVQYTNDQDEHVPDHGSVVIVVPQNVFPDRSNKIAAAQVAPNASPSAASSAIQNIREIGGDLTLVKTDGTFELNVPDRGKYYVLVLSRHMRPVEDVSTVRNDIGRVGRYFTPADELLGGFRYAWRPETVKRNRTLTAIVF